MDKRVAVATYFLMMNPIGVFLSFLPEINPFLAVAEACGVVGNAKRCPSACGQPVGLSIRRVKSISPARLAFS
jgi:hypothetical protein